MRDDINFFILMHSEDVVSDNSIVGYKPSTVGKLIDSSYNPMEVVPMLLYSAVKYDENKNPIYGFYTHRCLEGSIEIPAKTPEGSPHVGFWNGSCQNNPYARRILQASGTSRMHLQRKVP